MKIGKSAYTAAHQVSQVAAQREDAGTACPSSSQRVDGSIDGYTEESRADRVADES